MKSSIRWPVRLLVVVCLLGSFATPLQARVHRKHRKSPKSVYTDIASVNLSEMTITTEPKNSTASGRKTYRLTRQTKVTVDGHAGTLGDLKPGQRIRVGESADPDVAEELSATEPPPDPK